MIGRMQEESKRLTPTRGINLVGIDTFDYPGEGYYLVGNYHTEAEARAAIPDQQKETPYDKFVLIGPDGVLPNQP